MKQEKKEALWQHAEWREKEREKYLPYFTMDRHQKIIRQVEIKMTSLMAPP
jgi:hypothetical protein